MGLLSGSEQRVDAPAHAGEIIGRGTARLQSVISKSNSCDNTFMLSGLVGNTMTLD